MTKIKRFLGIKCMINIYYSLVNPCLIYGYLLQGNNYFGRQLSQLNRLQNKELVRIINTVPLHISFSPHYVHLGLLKFRDLVKL